MDFTAVMMNTAGGEKFLVSYLAQIERMASVLGGIPVWEVLPESAAAAAGVLFGDIILKVNRTPTPTYAEFLAAGRANLDDLDFEVFRNGQILALRAEATETRPLSRSASRLRRRKHNGLVQRAKRTR